jgi:hypothetical protein
MPTNVMLYLKGYYKLATDAGGTKLTRELDLSHSVQHSQHICQWQRSTTNRKWLHKEVKHSL